MSLWKSEKSGTFHYRFQYGGREYKGDTRAANRKEAQKEEARIRDEVSGAGTVADALARRAAVLRTSEPIPVEDGFDRAQAGATRRRSRGTKTEVMRSYWLDFTGWLAEHHPSVATLEQVTADHARAYLGHLQHFGRYSPRAASSGTQLAAATMNAIRSTCLGVFRKLAGETGAPNPFAATEPFAGDAHPREPYTPDELALIGRQAEAVPWIYHLFMVGFSTGLREGDICTMRLSNVDLEGRVLTGKQRKTGTPYHVPMLPGLHAYLSGLIETDPELSDAVREGRDAPLNAYLDECYRAPYKRNKLGARVAKFLEKPVDEGGCGIRTTRKVPGRSRAVKIKDVHSLRHTFVYLSAMHGIPMPVVQSVVGHLDASMTRLYADHADAEARRRMFARLPHYVLGDGDDGRQAASLCECGGAGVDVGEVRRKLEAMGDGTWKSIRDELLGMLSTG